MAVHDHSRLGHHGMKLVIQVWKVKSEIEVTQSCLTFWDPMDGNLPSSSVHRIFQARVVEWVAISFSRRSSWPRDRTQVSRLVGRCFTIWATREDLFLPYFSSFLTCRITIGEQWITKNNQNTIRRTGDFYMFSEDNPMRKERKYLWHVNGERFSKFFLGTGKLIVDKHQFSELWWNWIGS